MTYGFKKGQGATEYLVLLAVVLIVAMVAIALLGFFPGLAGDAKMAQSDSYWRGTARPFAVLEHSLKGTNLTLVLQNTEANQRQLTNISIAGSGFSYTGTPTVSYYSGGEKHIENMALTGTSCTAGSGYELYLNFTYSNADGTISGIKQYGEKPLAGKCSS